MATVSYDPKFDDEQIDRFRTKEAEFRRDIAQIVGSIVDRAWVSRVELAKVLGYRSTSQFSKWKSGQALIPPEKLALLALALDCSVTQFFPPQLHKRKWTDDLMEAIHRKERKRAIEIVVNQLPDDGA